jgi:hypothetical protein
LFLIYFLANLIITFVFQTCRQLKIIYKRNPIQLFKRLSLLSEINNFSTKKQNMF